MNSKNVDACQTEFSAALGALAPELEGFEDLYELDLIQDSKGKNVEQIDAARRRQMLLNNAVAALTALTSDGYPEVATMEVNPAIYDDLNDQVRTITAALARYKRGPGEATGGSVTIK